jgi:hypothetical protein
MIILGNFRDQVSIGRGLDFLWSLQAFPDFAKGTKKIALQIMKASVLVNTAARAEYFEMPLKIARPTPPV